MSKLPVQKYYARLVYRGIYTMDQIPTEDTEVVTKMVDDIIKEKGPYVPDPEIATEEIK